MVLQFQFLKKNWKNLRSDIVEIERQVLDGHLFEKRIDYLFTTDLNFVKVLASSLRPIFNSVSGKNVSRLIRDKDKSDDTCIYRKGLNSINIIETQFENYFVEIAKIIQ